MRLEVIAAHPCLHPEISQVACVKRTQPDSSIARNDVYLGVRPKKEKGARFFRTPKWPFLLLKSCGRGSALHDYADIFSLEGKLQRQLQGSRIAGEHRRRSVK